MIYLESRMSGLYGDAVNPRPGGFGLIRAVKA
jgi:hypothetical protein